MPTTEEIKKLSEQYAEFTDGSPADKAYIRAITQCFTEWLCKTHCIVEKREIKEMINQNQVYKDYDFLWTRSPESLIPERTDWDAMSNYTNGLYFLIDNIISLFGKELFNEE